MRTLFSLFIVALAAHVALGLPSRSGSTVKKNYSNYKVIRVTVTDAEQVRTLNELQHSDTRLDFWTEPKLNGFVDIMVEPGYLVKIQSSFQSRNVPFEILIDDVQTLIAAEERRRQEKLGSQATPAAIDWDEYYELETINSWLEEVARNNSRTVQLINIGKSTEGRNLTVLKITNGSGTSKPAIFITSTIHAREWITVATATYIVNQLTLSSSSDILNLVDVYIQPVINVDGYAYSHATDRLWRKTRSDHGSVLGCKGVDANRNFGFKWGEAEQPGSSGDKCSGTYRGPEPFSEPEAAAIRDFVANNSNVNWKLYLTIHSYGQYLLSPWGFTENLPSNYVDMKNLADDAAAALRAVYGTTYTTGSSANVLYFTDGTDQDWATGSENFDISYTIELRDTGRYGFLLPASQILPTATETWEAVKVLARGAAAL